MTTSRGEARHDETTTVTTAGEVEARAAALGRREHESRDSSMDFTRVRCPAGES